MPSERRHLLRKPQLVWMELDAHKRHYHVGHGNDSETIVPLGFDVTNCLQPCAWRGVPFRNDGRRTRPREATQIPERSSQAGRSAVGRRPPACHNDPPDATRPSSKGAPSYAPVTCTFSAPAPLL